MVVTPYDNARIRIIAAIQGETEDGWVNLNDDLREIFHEMYEQTKDPLYSQERFKGEGFDVPSKRGGKLLASILKFKNMGALTLKGERVRVTCFLLDLEDTLQIPPSHVEEIKRMARNLD